MSFNEWDEFTQVGPVGQSFRPKTPPLVIGAFICALGGFVFAIPAIVGLTLGIVSLRKVGRGVGRGLAIAAIIVSCVWIALWAVLGVQSVMSSDSGSAQAPLSQESTSSGDVPTIDPEVIAPDVPESSLDSVEPAPLADDPASQNAEGFGDGSGYSEISAREWALIAKNPANYYGKKIKVYGVITQFDTATGTDSFLADVGGTKQVDSLNYATNTVLRGSLNQLSDLVVGDTFGALVTVTGVETYDTQAGGNTTAPVLKIGTIARM